MKRRGLTIALVVALAAACLLGLAGVAQAGSWDDLPNAVLAQYGLTEDQVAQISEGYGSGLWLPNKPISRAQFVRMACVVFSIPSAEPMRPTYSDVPETHAYFSFVEGATSAGLINGVGRGRFSPNATITRQQAVAIIARQVAASNGYDLSKMSSATASAVLAGYSDGTAVSSVLRNALVFAINRGILSGSKSRLSPNTQLTRIQAAALLVRAGAPQITSVSPSAGSAEGGNTVVITGIGFAGLADAGAVRFGLTDALSYTVDSATQITAVVPAGTAGTSVTVTVRNSDGSIVATAPLRYGYNYGTPSVTSIDPGSGPAAGGNTVIINGSLLSGVTSVRFGAQAAKSFAIVSTTQIKAVAPAGAAGQTVEVTVTGPAGTSAVSADCVYRYGLPVITAIDPAAGPAEGGNTVVITGEGLFGASEVLFGTKEATGLSFNSSSQITVVAPAGADGTTVDVVVLGPGGESVAGSVSRYSYGAPLVTSVSPGAGPSSGYASVVIRGVGFTGLSGPSAVRFGARNALSYDVVSDTEIIAQAPAGTAGTPVNVTVTNPAGTSPATAQYLYYSS